VAMLRRFTLRRGNAKTLYATLRGQDQKPQQLPIGSVVTLTAWRKRDLPVHAIDAKPCVVLDDGTTATRGRIKCDFSAGESLALADDVYELRFDALVAGSIPLTFPDNDAQRDPERNLLLLVTEQV
jgi:hypothetical protein